MKAEVTDAHARVALVDQLRTERIRRGLTQREVAARMGVTTNAVLGFERVTQDPRVSTIQRYARALGYRAVVMLETAQ